MSLGDEPDITINGVKLTTAEAMTVRVALSSLMMNMVRDGLGDDETGKAICDGYKRAMDGIFKAMTKERKDVATE